MAPGFTWLHLWRGLLVGLLAIAVVTAVIFGFKPVVPAATLSGLYVLPPMPVAVWWGMGPALVTAVGSAVAFDLFFFDPTFALTPSDPHIEAIFVISGVTAIVVSGLASRVQRRTRETESLARLVQRVAEEQAALRRVATLVARGAPPEELFAAVAAEAGQVLTADITAVGRYDPEGGLTVVGRWSSTSATMAFPVGSRVELGGQNMVTLVFETGRSARIDHYADATGTAADPAREAGFRSAVGAPISVEGRLWGAMNVASTGAKPLPADTEARLAGFTDLVATAIANAQARLEVRGHAEEQAALRRVATLVALAAPAEEVFAAVSAEVGGVLGADVTVLARFDPSGAETTVGVWRSDGDSPVDVGTTTSLGGRNVSTQVFQTGLPARIDDYADTGGEVGEHSRGAGVRASAGVPITVEGRLWGVMIAASRQDPLPPETEARLARFTTLVATAIANAEARAALTASRARIVAAADAARGRIERDLHDGAQQRLVSLALRLRMAQGSLPPEAGGVTELLGDVAEGLTSVLDELRELARGLHPAALAEGGLRPALKTLARRSPVPVRLIDVGVDQRLPQAIELAAYYVVSEALTNTAKHAAATDIEVRVAADDGVLRVRVHDDGRGGADPALGSGLVGLADRIEALGGHISLHSPPGEGTTVEIAFPLTDPSQPGSHNRLSSA
jgi:signal transduction histidine kinase